MKNINMTKVLNYLIRIYSKKYLLRLSLDYKN